MTNEKEEKKEVSLEINELVDLANDPVVFLFYKHLNTALQLFGNPNIKVEEVIERYEKLFDKAYKILKFGFRELSEEDKKNLSETDKKLLEIVEILVKRNRKIKVAIVI